MEVIPAQTELLQFIFQAAKVHAQIQHGTNEHVAADAAEDVQIKRFHFSIRRAGVAGAIAPASLQTCSQRLLIWLAA